MLGLLLDLASGNGGGSRDREYDRGIVPGRDVSRWYSIRTDHHCSLRRAKAVVALDLLQIERRRGGRGTRVSAVIHLHVAEGSDGQGPAPGCAHPRSDAIAIDFTDGRRGLRIGTIHI